MGRRDFCLQNELVGSFLNNIDDDDMGISMIIRQGNKFSPTLRSPEKVGNIYA